MTKLPWLHVSDLPAGNAHFGFLCVAASVTGLLKTSFGGRFLCPIIAGAVVFFGAGLRLQGAPVMNADIARLLEAGMSEQVILQAIAVGQPDFDLSPDALIVLKNKGATPAIFSAMLATAQPAAGPSSPAAAPALPLAPLPTDVMATSVEVPSVSAPAATSPAPAMPPVPAGDEVATPPAVEPDQVSFAYFQGQLAPYGNWVQLPGYGWCWQPAVGSENAAWRPYCDSGHWDYTDQGWFWESDYPWGDVVFHYGRWARQLGYGWIWVPDYFWAPSWVAWRYAEREGCIGWAPLPPAAQFVVGVGLTWHGSLVVNADFGLGPADFCFVGSNNFWEHDFRGYLLRQERAEYVWRRSVVRNGYRFNNGRLAVEGLGAQRIGLLTHRQVRPVAVNELSRREQHEHFFARQQDVGRHVEIRREAATRENVRHEPTQQGQFQHPEVRGEAIQREQAAQQHNGNARVIPSPAPAPRVEPPRQTPGGVNPAQKRLQPTSPPVQAPVVSKPATPLAKPPTQAPVVSKPATPLAKPPTQAPVVSKPATPLAKAPVQAPVASKPATPLAKAPAASKPAPKPAPNKDEKEKNN
jgi:hypothetical protein